LILTIASGLSDQQAAEVCECQIAVIESRVSDAWLEISRALREALPGRKNNFPRSYLQRAQSVTQDVFTNCAEPKRAGSGLETIASFVEILLQSRNAADTYN
jgi:hypothetical protein